MRVIKAMQAVPLRMYGRPSAIPKAGCIVQGLTHEAHRGDRCVLATVGCSTRRRLGSAAVLEARSCATLIADDRSSTAAIAGAAARSRADNVDLRTFKGCWAARGGADYPRVLEVVEPSMKKREDSCERSRRSSERQRRSGRRRCQSWTSALALAVAWRTKAASAGRAGAAVAGVAGSGDAAMMPAATRTRSRTASICLASLGATGRKRCASARGDGHDCRSGRHRREP